MPSSGRSTLQYDSSIGLYFDEQQSDIYLIAW